MSYTSLSFLLYFLPITCIVYFLLSWSTALQNVWLLGVSLVFYAWGDPRSVLMLAGILLANWLFGLILGAKMPDRKRLRKAILLLGILANLSVLPAIRFLGLLPLGALIYTLQSLSYLLEVYRGQAESRKNPIQVGLYIAFFPQLLGGPIVRFSQFADSLRSRRTSWEDFRGGVNRFAIGFLKKILIADRLAPVTDLIFNLAKTGRKLYELPAATAWIGCIGFIFQVYFLMSGLADMAIGLARIFGFRYEENFDRPYASKSITEFWHRFQITLIHWFRAYIYTPYGGSSEENQDLMVKNTLIVWLLIGLWFCPDVTGIVFGVFFFLLIIFERLMDFDHLAISPVIKRVYTWTAVFLGLLVLRSDSFHQLREMFKDLFMMNHNVAGNAMSLWILKETWPAFALAFLCLLPIGSWLKRFIERQKTLRRGYRGIRAALACAFATVLVLGGCLFAEETFAEERLSSEMLEAKHWEELEEDLENRVAGALKLRERIGAFYRTIGKQEIGDFAYALDAKGGYEALNFWAEAKDIDYRLIAQRLYLFREQVENKGGHFTFILFPDKLNEAWNSVDSGIPFNDFNYQADVLLAWLNFYGIDYLDLRETMKTSGLSYEEMFCRTDSRWTARAAFTAYGELVDYLNRKYDAGMDSEGFYRNPDNYLFESVEGIFVGDIGQKVGLDYAQASPEDFCVVTPKFELNVNWTTQEDDFASSQLYLDRRLKTDNPFDEDVYEFYLNGLNDRDYIVNEDNPEGPTAWFIRDEYASPLIIDMVPLFSRISCSCGRNTSDRYVKNEIVESCPDYVFIGYNIENLLMEYFRFYADDVEQFKKDYAIMQGYLPKEGE